MKRVRRRRIEVRTVDKHRFAGAPAHAFAAAHLHEFRGRRPVSVENANERGHHEWHGQSEWAGGRVLILSNLELLFFCTLTVQLVFLTSNRFRVKLNL